MFRQLRNWLTGTWENLVIKDKCDAPEAEAKVEKVYDVVDELVTPILAAT